MSVNNYRPEIDALRAIAIIPVVLFHFFPDHFPNGFLGVDVFFVISGYLITGILMRTVKNGTFSLTDFWGRRIRRLFPVIATMITAGMTVGYLTLFGDEWESLTYQALFTLLSSANFLIWRTAGDYWGQSAESMPFLHMWSLAIEEQFYLVFPPILCAGIRRFGITRTRQAMTAAAVLSFLLMLTASHTHKAAAFYLLPPRAWELLSGCILSTINRDQRDSETAHKSSTRAYLGLSLIFAAFIFPIGSPGISIVHTATAVLGTCMVLQATANIADTTGWPFGWAPAVFVGKISYSWYMWHWPIKVILPTIIFLSAQMAFGLSFVAGIVSWAFIEQRTRFLPGRKLIPIICSLLVTAILSTSLPFVTTRPSISYNVPKRRFQANVQPPYTAEVLGSTGNYQTGVTVGQLPITTKKHAVLLGDSHGVMYYPVLLDICRQNEITLTSFAADGGTWPFFVRAGTNPETYYAADSTPGSWNPDKRTEFDSVRRQFLQSHEPKVVILCGRWSFYFRELGAEEFAAYANDLIQAFPPDSQFIAIGQPPTLPFGSAGFTSGTLNLPPMRAFTEDPAERQTRQQAHELLETIAVRSTRGQFVSVNELFETARGIQFIDNGTILYRDDDHLNDAGAAKCQSIIAAKLLQAMSSANP